MKKESPGIVLKNYRIYHTRGLKVLCTSYKCPFCFRDPHTKLETMSRRVHDFYQFHPGYTCNMIWPTMAWDVSITHQTPGPRFNFCGWWGSWGFMRLPGLRVVLREQVYKTVWLSLEAHIQSLWYTLSKKHQMSQCQTELSIANPFRSLSDLQVIYAISLEHAACCASGFLSSLPSLRPF